MKNTLVLNQESFDALLVWLDPDRERAGQKYEEIRRRLIKIFTCRCCPEPEDLADEAINRVVKRVKEVAGSYTGDPALYFYGVANKVHLEYVRRRPAPRTPTETSPPEEGPEYECLEHCIGRLPPENRELILQYYQDDKRAKVDNRRRLAERLGIALNALRIRAYRIRMALQECVEDCVRRSEAW